MGLPSVLDIVALFFPFADSRAALCLRCTTLQLCAGHLITSCRSFMHETLLLHVSLIKVAEGPQAQRTLSAPGRIRPLHLVYLAFSCQYLGTITTLDRDLAPTSRFRHAPGRQLTHCGLELLQYGFLKLSQVLTPPLGIPRSPEQHFC